MKLSILEGSFAVLWAALAIGPFLQTYYTRLGISDWEKSWIIAIPQLANVFQILFSQAVGNMVNRKFYLILLVTIARFLWLPITLIPFVPETWRIPLFLGLLTLCFLLSSVNATIWMVWMEDLIPKKIRGRYYGTRNAVHQLVNATAVFLGGFYLGNHPTLTGEYLYLFLAAVFFGGISSWLISYQPERLSDYQLHRKPKIHFSIFLEILHERAYRPFFFYWVLWNFVNFVPGAFWVPYMMQEIRMSEPQVGMVFSVQIAFSVIFFYLWGRVVDTYGARPVLILCTLCCAPVSVIYILATHHGYEWMFLEEALAGTFNYGVTIATFVLMTSFARKEHRSFFISFSAALGGLAGFLGSLTGGALVTYLPSTTLQGFHISSMGWVILFAIVGRGSCLFFALNIGESGSTRHWIQQIWQESAGYLTRFLSRTSINQ